MLQVQHLRKDYGAATILSDIHFIINDGEHVGLIGPNGSGKSTLLRCIVGQEQPDGGSIAVAPGASIGYLAQSFDERLGRTLGAVLATAQVELNEAETALQRTAEELTAAADIEGAMARYDAALARFEALGGYEREHRAAAVLAGLGLGALDEATPVASLSGGQKTRLGLAVLLLREPDLLLLDEPTNHLDVEALEWLEGFVQRYRHAALIVSHDREFLDRTVGRILALDAETHTLRSYTGNYSAFAAARRHEGALHDAAWKQQQDYIAQVRADITRLKGQAEGRQQIRSSSDRDDKFIRNARDGSQQAAQKARARERKLERYLAADERVEKPRRNWGLKLDFGPPPPGGRAVLELEGVSFRYPAETKEEHQTLDAGSSSFILHDLSFDIWHGERVAIVGPNGAGKSTLLKLIAGQLQPTMGRVRIGANIRLGLLAQEHETLDLGRSVLDHVLNERPLSETEARSFLHFFLFGGDSVFRPVGACSLGERARLQLALLVLRGCNLLLLDEPLNHLDIEGREHFEEALRAFEGTVIVVAHDRAFLRSFAERVVELHAG